MSPGSRLGVVALAALLVFAGCAAEPSSTPDSTPIVDTLDSTGTPTSQDRVTDSGTVEPGSETTEPDGDTGGSDGGTGDSTATVGDNRDEPTRSESPAQAGTDKPTQTPTQTATERPTVTRTATPTDASTSLTATVVDVTDGDTVTLRFSNGSRETARLLGVDTPETHAPVAPDEWEGVPDTQAGRDCLADWGERATQFTVDRIQSETVAVEFDENEPRRGYYGRLLVYLTVGDDLFNDDLVRRGYARVYTDSRFEKKAAFLEHERSARDATRGAWTCRDAAASTPTVTPTDAPTESPTPTQTDEPSAPAAEALVVDAVHEDASGNDHENENDEWVRFRNTADGPLDISGWTVADEAGHTYRVPEGTTLAPGATVTLYTGSGSDSADSLYWGSDAAIWNNGGDTIVVRTANGETVIRHEY